MGMEEFFGAFDGSEPVTVEETPVAEETSEVVEPAASEGEEGIETGAAGEDEPSQDDPAEKGGEEGAEEQPSGGDSAQDQTFTLQIGEEERQCTPEEMTELAQKGAGYDDLKAERDEAVQARDQLQTQLDGQQGVMDIMKQIAEKSDKTVQELAKQMYINFRKSAGVSEDAAALELENAQLKKQIDAGKPAQQETKPADDAQTRAQKEISEFRQLHPGVKLDAALVAKLKPDLQKGMTLANAYQKMLNDQKAAELQRKEEANKQNAKNRANSPGSQQDSGGRRQKSGVDDFFAQFS